MKYLTDNELKKYGKTYSFSKRAIALVNHQKANWSVASENYANLRHVQTRSFDFDHFRIDCQHNPQRIHSSTAATDAASVGSRPCFLCEINRPAEQAGIPFESGFSVLCNPFPIFPYHLTITAHDHEPQKLEPHLNDFLKITRELNEFAVFYNGPECGASAPDHFHFQAGIREMLPIEEELNVLLTDYSAILIDSMDIKISAVEHYLRRFVCFVSPDPGILRDWISRAMNHLDKPEGAHEPMINLLAWYTGGEWKVVMFPRAAQRPRQYYAVEFDHILVSPAAVELGGLMILPREEDYYKIHAEDLSSIFGQVTVQKNEFDTFINKLTQTI